MLEVKKISGGYSKRKDVVHDISFQLERSDILCVLGPNGCGKTSLFKLILGFLPKSSGSILIDNKSLAQQKPNEIAKYLAYIPQAHNPVFNYKVIDMVLLGRSAYIATFAAPQIADYKLANSALSLLGIKYLAEKEYTKISGGERQLVLIARAICQQAEILVMDEPSASLDYANQQLVMKTILGLSDEGYSIILSTHSPEQPFRVATKTLLMKAGRAIAMGTPAEVLTPVALRAAYDINIEVFQVHDSNKCSHSFCLSV